MIIKHDIDESKRHLKCQVITKNGDICLEPAVAQMDSADDGTAVCFEHFKACMGITELDVNYNKRDLN